MKNLARIFFSSLLVLVLAISFTSCSKDEEAATGAAGGAGAVAPQKSEAVKQVESLVMAINTKDADVLDSFGVDADKRNMINLLLPPDASLEIAEIVSEKTEGDSAVVVAKIKAKTGDKELEIPLEVSMIKDGKLWKVKGLKPYSPQAQ